MFRVMHANDPLAPGQILDRISNTRPFPVQDCNDLAGRRVKQDVIGPVIAVH